MELESPRGRGRPRKGGEANAGVLLDAALAAFAANGFDRANLRAIAAAAEVDVALLAYRFGSKLGLWKAVIERVAEESLPVLAAKVAEEASGPPRQRLEAAIGQFVSIVCSRPQFARFVMTEVFGPRDEERFAFLDERLVRPTRAILLPIVAEAGGTSGRDPSLLFAMALGTISHAVATRDTLARYAPAALDEELFQGELARTAVAGILGDRTTDAERAP